MPGPDFLDLPTRASKPRGVGITHVLDRGMPLAQSADLLAMSGSYIDVWKLGWGLSYLDPNLAAKLELLAGHSVLASPGGTLLEIAWAQGRATEFLDWARGCGFPCVEVSAGTVAMDQAAKQELIAEAARHFIVLAEVGPKDPGVRLTPAQWAQALSGDLEAPREQQQAWFVRRFGPDVNLANVPPADVLGLETLRLSLRADTYGAWSPGPLPARNP